MEYFKKLTSYPSVTYLGLQTDKVWAKSIFDRGHDFFDFYWQSLLTIILTKRKLLHSENGTYTLIWQVRANAAD